MPRREKNSSLPHSSIEQSGIKEKKPRELVPIEKLHEYLESRTEKQIALSEQERILHKRLWPELSQKHRSYKQVRELLDLVFDINGLPKEEFALSIFESDYPDVHVVVGEKNIRLSASFLRILKGDAEKIIAVLSHEVGHLLLAHYKTAGPEEYDPLNEHTQGYEHEYQADRASVISTNRLGINPLKLAEALGDIERYLYSKTKHSKDMSEPGIFDHGAWVLSTHPHTSRRTLAIKRDASSLPKYPKTFRNKRVTLPKETDFYQINPEFSKWEYVDENLEGSDNSFPDCFWEEYPAPVDYPYSYKFEGRHSAQPRSFMQEIGNPRKLLERLEELDQKTREHLKQERLKYPNSPYYKDGKPAEPPDATAEEINKWGVNNKEDIRQWWFQAGLSLDTVDAYDDLAADVEGLSIKATFLLLQNICPEYMRVSENIVKTGSRSKVEVIDMDATKDRTIQDAIISAYTPYIGDTYIVGSLLVKNLFKKDSSFATLEGMARIGAFLQEFFETHGDGIPYQGARFFATLEKLYRESRDDAQREAVLALVKKYHKRWGGNFPVHHALAQVMMPEIYGVLDAAEPRKYFLSNEQIAAKEQKTIWSDNYQLPKKVREVAESESLTKDEAREALRLVPRNFQPKNRAKALVGTLKNIAEDEKLKDSNREIAEETDPHTSAALLSGSDFDKKYFGTERETYERARYAKSDEYILEYVDIAYLWLEAEYLTDWEALPQGRERLSNILDTFPAQSARRDVLICESIGWEKLLHAEDVLTIQERIDTVEDVSLLFELLSSFSNPLLQLSVSQQLWIQYKIDPDTFMAAVPKKELERVEGELEDQREGVRSRDLVAVLLCYQNPTYSRDELLRPLIDAAKDRAEAEAIASWTCEPPPGSLRPRATELVAVTETMLDVMRSMPLLDRQEILLYFLGHRFFYSAVDAKFFAEIRTNQKTLRSDAIFLERADFQAQFKIKKAEAKVKGGGEYRTLPGNSRDMYKDPGERFKKKYLVEKPDSLIFLTKSTGLPVELLLKQQKVATTKREQRDFITQMLTGTEGLLHQENSREFLNAVARNVVEGSSWAAEKNSGDRKAMIDLLAYALHNCPEDRLPDLFLGLWNLQQEHESLPKIVASMMRELGSLFIKAGQYLGTQSGSLPPEWIREFRSLSDRNVRAEKTLVYEHEFALYGKESPFARIGAKKGEGSMAAVYEGELKSAEGKPEQRVAVKILHSNIEDALPLDVKFLDKLVTFVNERKQEFSVRLPSNLAHVSERQIRKELAYDTMRSNNTDIASVLTRGDSHYEWRVPQIFESVSKPGFIVYDYSSGEPLDSLEPELAKDAKGETAKELLRQILVEGIYQADPNIGNFKITLTEEFGKKAVIDWLDTDHTGRLSREETHDLRKLISQIGFIKDPKVTSRILTKLIHPTEEEVRVSSSTIESWLIEKDILGQTSFEDIDSLFTSFLDYLALHKLALKEQYVTLLRTLGLMRPLLAEMTAEQYSALSAYLSE